MKTHTYTNPAFVHFKGIVRWHGDNATPTMKISPPTQKNPQETVIY